MASNLACIVSWTIKVPRGTSEVPISIVVDSAGYTYWTIPFGEKSTPKIIAIRPYSQAMKCGLRFPGPGCGAMARFRSAVPWLPFERISCLS
jgi:hypothetical protein